MSKMTTAKAISAMADLISASADITIKLQRASAAIQRAYAEGREVNDDDWAAVNNAIDESDADLTAAILAARNTK